MLDHITATMQATIRACLGLTGEPLTAVVDRRRHGSPFPVDSLAAASLASTLEAAAELMHARTGHRPSMRVDPTHRALAFQSERLLVPATPLGPIMEPLSRFARTKAGWIRLHANYPHHHRALMRVLGEPGSAAEAVERIRGWDGVELEARVHEAGGAAAVVRSQTDWEMHPQGRALGQGPLLEISSSDSECGALAAQNAPLPCSGLRVLDLTRVIAGPVATRMLAAFGAHVIRVDPLDRPELRLHVLDGHVGKTPYVADFTNPADRRQVLEVLRSIDLVILGYRPGAMAKFGLDPTQLAQTHPWISTVSLSAWGTAGPWAHRRGFDSLVQAACGIAVACGTNETPGVLPVQALDHATGYLAAAAALRALAHRHIKHRAAHAWVGLAQTARLLQHSRLDPNYEPSITDPKPFMVRVPTPDGPLGCLSPPGSLDGAPLRWPTGISPPRPLTSCETPDG